MKTKIRIKKAWISFAMLIVGLMFTITFSIHTKRDLEKEKKQDFELVCNEISTKIITRLHAHAQLLRSAASFFESSDLVTRDDWKKFIKSSRIDENLPGIQGVSYSVLIKKDQLQKHILQVRKEGFPNYKVWPVGNREFYTPVTYIEPFSGRNLRAFGYDNYSEPTRRKAMEQARDNDQASLTGKVTLVQETDINVQVGTIMFVPVYRRDMPVNSIIERRAAILGWVSCPYRMADLMQGILGVRGLNDEFHIQLHIYDNDSIKQSSIIYSSQCNDILKNNDKSVQKQILPIEFYGKKWTLLFSKSDEQYFYFQAKVLIVLISGIIISILLFGLSYSVLYTLTNAELIAGQLTSELKESETKFRLFFDLNPDLVIICTLTDKKLIEVNDNFLKKTGFKLEEVLGKTQDELNLWVNLDEKIHFNNKINKKGYCTNFETELCDKKGKKFTVLISSRIVDFSGQPYLLSVIRDISERKIVEVALKESETNFKNLFNFIPDIVNIVRVRDGKIVAVNNNFIHQLGFTADEIIGKTAVELNIWKDLTHRKLLFDEIKRLGCIDNLETAFLRKDGSEFIGIISSKQIDFSGEPHILSATHDITDRKQAEVALMESEDNFKNLFNFNPDIILIARLSDSLLVEVNNIFIKRSGFTLDEVIGKSITELNIWVNPADKEQLYKELNENGYCVNFETELRSKDGNIYTGLISAKLFNFSGEPHILSVIRDITERKQVEEALKKERQRLDSIIKGTNVATWEWNVQSGETNFNERWAEIIGYTLEELSPVSIDTWKKFTHPDDLKLSNNLLEKHFSGTLDYFEIESRMKHKNGNWVWVLDSGKVASRTVDGKPLMMFGTHTDVTERRQAEDDLKESREQLRNLASHLQNARENERKSITLEIHDSLAQFLVALKMDMGIYLKKISKANFAYNSEELKTELDKFIKQTDNTIKTTRNIMNGLRPEQLELLGFVEATEVYLHDFEAAHHIVCHFENKLSEHLILPEQALTLFRILQESFNNILKHSMATLVTVQLSNYADNLVLEIIDNGVGYDKNNNGRPDSFGLISMKEQIKLLNGKFDISGNKGEGTKVRVEISGGVKSL